MRRPSRPKLLAFIKLSAAYWLIVSVVVGFVSLRTCGMHPDFVELCSLTPIKVATTLSLLSFVMLTLSFFRYEVAEKG